MQSTAEPTFRRATAPFRQHVRHIVSTTALAAALVVSVAMSLSPAAALPVPPGGDSFQRGCKALQDQVNDLVDEYATASAERQKQIINEGRNIANTWRSIGCQAVWGDIVGLVFVQPVDPWSDHEAVYWDDQEIVPTDTGTDVVRNDDPGSVFGGNQEVFAP